MAREKLIKVVVAAAIGVVAVVILALNLFGGDSHPEPAVSATETESIPMRGGPASVPD